jgi:hypothetical protein
MSSKTPMGAWSSHYRDVGQEAYTFNNNGAINVSTFQTGDLIFFSDEFPTSSFHRLSRRIRGKLWNNCGVVIKAHDLFQNQTLLLETAGIHPDDHLVDKIQLKSVEGGVRIVNLSDRLKSQQGVFPAVGIRRRGRPYGKENTAFEDFDAYNQYRNMERLRPLMDGERSVTSNTLALQALKDLRIMFASYAKLDLNQLAGRALNRYCKDPLKYTKIEVFLWPSEKELKKLTTRVQE